MYLSEMTLALFPLFNPLRLGSYPPQTASHAGPPWRRLA
jgi:hypothetical protein